MHFLLLVSIEVALEEELHTNAYDSCFPKGNSLLKQ